MRAYVGLGINDCIKLIQLSTTTLMLLSKTKRVLTITMSLCASTTTLSPQQRLDTFHLTKPTFHRKHLRTKKTRMTTVIIMR